MKEEHHIYRAIIAICVFVLLNTYIQLQAPCLVGYDGYFHIKFSDLLKEHIFIDRLPWLYYTMHKEFYRNHHLLFHYILIPFTFINLVTGAKLAAILMNTFTNFVYYLILTKLNVKYALAWTILTFFLFSPEFILRMSMLRVQIIFVAIIIICIYALITNRMKLLFLLSILAVYLYDGFILIPILATLYGVIRFFYLRDVLSAKIALLVYISTALGIVVNPYFPQNLESIVFNYKRALAPPMNLSIGSEWSSFSTIELVKQEYVLIMLISIIYLFSHLLLLMFYKNGKLTIDKHTLVNITFLISTSWLFIILLFISKRYVEYAVPVVSFSFACLFLRSFPRKTVLITTLMVMFFTLSNLDKAIDKIKSLAFKLDSYEAVSKYIKTNSKYGDIVFNSEWWEFPFLFFFNTKNYYVVGLDPIYMYESNRTLYFLYRNIVDGFVKEPGKVIRSRFKAKYVVVNTSRTSLISNLLKESKAKIALKTKRHYVFIIE